MTQRNRMVLHRVVATAILAISTRLSAQRPDTPSAPGIRVQGTVYDSVGFGSLAGAVIEFVRDNGGARRSVTTTANASGQFDITLTPGLWVAAISHPRFDSIGVTLPVRTVDVSAAMRGRITLATPSSHTIARAYCPEARDSDAVLVGMVHAAGTQTGLAAAQVLVQWSDLVFRAGTVTRSVPTSTANTDRDGWYVLCGVPAKAELVAWAERGGASTGIIAVEMPSTGLKRLDLGLDSTATIASSSGRAHVDSATLEGEARRPPARTGTRMLRGVVRGYEGNAVTNARVRVIGQRFANTDSRGAFTLDSLPGGSQTLEVRALGYVPVVEAVDVSARGTAVDTVVLASSKGLLDTVRVTATGKSNVDRTGFEMRRHGVGTYLTRSDVLARRPLETTGLFTATPGVFVQSQGFATTVKMGAPGSGYCTPALWIDGSLQASTSASTGPALPSAAAAFQSSTIPRKGDTTAPPNRTAADPALHMEEGPITELNQLVVPAEIEGIEIYRRMSEVPPQFEPSGTFSCGAIVIWTRLRFELPAPPADGKP